MDESYQWELRDGDKLLGTLTFKNMENFGVSCEFSAMPAFEVYRPLFALEAKAAELVAERNEQSAVNTVDTLYAQIGELNLSLHFNDTFDEENVIWLHIVDEDAWFRPLRGPYRGGWVDRPFHDGE